MTNRRIAEHHMCGSLEGVIVALYETESAHGTHFAAVIEPDATVNALPITDEAKARRSYHALIDELHATQRAA